MTRANPFFALPRACRRILILSNVREGFELPALQRGDVVVHLNCAVHFEEVWRRGMSKGDVMHVLFVQPQSEGLGTFYWPERSLNGFHGVFTLRGSQYRGFPFFAEYEAAGGRRPSAGFAVANMLRAYHPGLPIWLVGFAPGRRGTGRAPCYQWGVEAAWYAEGRGDFRLLEPREAAVVGECAPPRLRLVITSCVRYRSKRDAQRETWLAQLPSWVSYHYYIGDGESSADEPDVIRLPGVGDGYFDLPSKVKAAFAHAASLGDWEWLGKLDDDAYLVPERLPALLREPAVFCGRAYRGEYARGGPGYFLTRGALEALLDHAGEIPDTGAEDQLVGKKLIELGYPLTDCRDLHPFRSEGLPGVDNDAIGTSNLTPDEVREAHARMKEVR